MLILFCHRTRSPFHQTYCSAAILVLGVSLGWASCARAQGTNEATGLSESNDAAEEGIAFFENRIRPVLVESCLDCHSRETELSGGLSLDSQADLLAGGDSGASIDLGDHAASLLLKALSYGDPNLQMPPDEKLPEGVVEDFRKWLALGAPDPRQAMEEGRPESTALSVEQAHQHWAYRPIDAKKFYNSDAGIDAFVEQAADARGLSVLGPADERALVRRLYYDLTGLPPSYRDVQRYLNDDRPNKYEQLVERLLATTAFGEHFARHWMDVARYAESITLRGFVLPNAWRYRDWLVGAYNSDLPFDQMVRQQIAGDLLPSKSVSERARQVVATGFLAMGNTNLEQQDKEQLEMDYIDEQLEVMGRAFLGQTIGCARCHDHKFDPIPTRDYYALAGILRSSKAMNHDNVSKWIDAPLPLEDSEQKIYNAAAQSLKSIKQKQGKLQAELSLVKEGVADGKHVGLKTIPGVVVDNTFAKLVGSWTESEFIGRIVGEHYIHAIPSAPSTATFEPEDLPPGEYEVRISYSASANRTTKAKVDVFSADEQRTVFVNQREKPPVAGLWFSLGVFRFEKDGQAYVMLSTEDSNGHVIADAVQFLPMGSQGEKLAKDGREQAADASLAGQKALKLERQIAELETQKMQAKEVMDRRPKYLTITQLSEPQDVAIHVRGNVHLKTDVIPRGVLTALEPKVEISTTSNGRLELANWIASKENPLTARVYANRVWCWLMGRGIAGSVNNFGTTGFEPTHPELLDWLAIELIEKDWSTKSLVRLIVCSDAYKRQVGQSKVGAEIDPENQFYWRGQQRCLSVEMLRDTMLTISGELDGQVGGPTIRPGTSSDYSYEHQGVRRSIYQPVFRNSLPPLFEVFDFADPSASIGQRARSTVATQALTMRNHPWVLARAKAAAKHFWAASDPGVDRDRGLSSGQLGDDRELVRRVYRECLQRPPLPQELSTAIRFLGNVETATQREEKISQLVHAIFCSLDFRYPR